MRTVTFSNREVKATLKRDFRLAWQNLEGEKAAGASFAHAPKDPAGTCTRGVGEHNVQILFATPEGEILHAVAGYLSAEDLLDEIALAQDLAEKLKQIESAKARRRMVELTHRQALAADKKLETESLFGDFKKNRLVRDHEFCRKKALMDAREFEPTAMVGRSQTFFGSSQGSGAKEQIGTMPKNGSKPINVNDLMREIEERQKRGRPQP